MALAYSYIRFSSKPQELGDSLRRQGDGAVRLCDRHGWTLDESVSLRDMGVSAFKGKNRDKGALAEFLRLAERGSIPRGSWLIIENLDRLSREDLRPAFSLLLRILDAGVSVATVQPEQLYRHDKTDQISLMVAIIELSRGHSESAAKSARVRESWKGRAAKIGDEIMTGVCPGWLVAREDRKGFDLIPERAAVVQHVFRLACDGAGVTTIAKTMNGLRMPPPTARGKSWHGSTVHKILTSRTTLGEFQRHEDVDGVRVPVGKPVIGYYPAVVTEAEWYAARDALERRTLRKSPVSEKNRAYRESRKVKATNKRPNRKKWVKVSVRGVTNLFTGLCADAETGGNLVIQYKTAADPVLVSSTAMRGVGGAYNSFPYSVVESALLRCVRELKPADLAPEHDGADEVAELSGRLAELDGKIDRTRGKYKAAKTEDEEKEWGGMLNELVAERGVVAKSLQDATAAAQTSHGDTLGEAQTLAGMLETATPDELPELRTRLRARFGSLVEKVWVCPVSLGPTRTAPKGCLIQVDFRNGAESRQILTRSHKPAFITVTGDMIRHQLPRDVEGAKAAVVAYWSRFLRKTRRGGVVAV